EHGYDGTSVRAVATEAGVAANLITRYFGGKAGLFAAATTIDLHARGAFAGPPQALGDRIARRVVQRWESAAAADPLLMMIRSARSPAPGGRRAAQVLPPPGGGPTPRAPQRPPRLPRPRRRRPARSRRRPHPRRSDQPLHHAKRAAGARGPRIADRLARRPPP